VNARSGPFATPERVAALLCVLIIPTIIALIMVLARPLNEPPQDGSPQPTAAGEVGPADTMAPAGGGRILAIRVTVPPSQAARRLRGSTGITIDSRNHRLPDAVETRLVAILA
jgi:hypothetical protein